MMKSRRIALAVAALAAGALGGQMTVATSAAFDSAAWKAEAGNRKAKNPRAAMASDAEQALKPSMTRQEVEQLLGRPDEHHRLHIYGAPATGSALHAKAVRFGVDGKVAKGSNNIAKDVSGDGMTPKQVSAVIGEPTEIREDYVYNLGTPNMGLDPTYLHVEFDRDGALVRHFREQG